VLQDCEERVAGLRLGLEAADAAGSFGDTGMTTLNSATGGSFSFNIGRGSNAGDNISSGHSRSVHTHDDPFAAEQDIRIVHHNGRSRQDLHQREQQGADAFVNEQDYFKNWQSWLRSLKARGQVSDEQYAEFEHAFGVFDCGRQMEDKGDVTLKIEAIRGMHVPSETLREAMGADPMQSSQALDKELRQLQKAMSPTASKGTLAPHQRHHPGMFELTDKALEDRATFSRNLWNSMKARDSPQQSPSSMAGKRVGRRPPSQLVHTEKRESLGTADDALLSPPPPPALRRNQSRRAGPMLPKI
jgi:hypothetical protein